MGQWTSRFIADLGAAAVTPMWRLRRVQFASEAGADWSAYSHKGSPRIGRVRVEGSKLDDYTLSTVAGRCVVELLGADLGDLSTCVPRGTFLALDMGFPGYGEADYQTVALGVLRQVSGARPRWVLEMIDAITGLRQRATNTATVANLFCDIDGSTTLTADYATGDTTLTVSSTTGFSRVTGAYGAVHVTPTTGDPFYLLTSAETGTTFTVAASDVLNTTRVAAVIGDEVTRAALMNAHPIQVALQVLLSTGAGTNTSYDVNPSSWGLAVPVGYIDVTDAVDYQNNVMTAGGAYASRWAINEPTANAAAFLTGFLADFGCYLTTRQGMITVRAQQGSNTPIAALQVWQITAADVVNYSLAWFAPSHQAEFASVAVRTVSASTSHVTGSVYQRPIEQVRVFDLSGYEFATNASGVRTEITNRTQEAAERTPEEVTMRLRGWQWAAMSPGDLCELTLTNIESRVCGSEYKRKRGKVVQVSPTFEAEPATDVVVLVYADFAAFT